MEQSISESTFAQSIEEAPGNQQSTPEEKSLKKTDLALTKFFHMLTNFYFFLKKTDVLNRES